MTERLFDPQNEAAQKRKGLLNVSGYGPNDAVLTKYRPPELKDHNVVVHQDRVDETLDPMMEAYYARSFPYDLPAARVPHETSNMPVELPLGGVEHAMFHFVGCYYMRGGIDSYNAYTRLGKIYSKRPELWNCDYVVSRSLDDDSREQLEAEIAQTLKYAGLGFQATIARGWVENAHRLIQGYEGDPRKIFEGTSDYAEIVGRVKRKGKNGFFGFREKMTSMLAYFLADDKLIPGFTYPIPIDFHVSRISVASGMVTFPDLDHEPDLDVWSDQLQAALRDIYTDYAVRKNHTPEDLCNAVWLLSGVLCSEAPGNAVTQVSPKDERWGRSTLLAPIKVNPGSNRDREKYAKTCAKCPASLHCKWNIPAGRYYIHGALIRDVKLELLPPAQQLSLDF